MPRRTDLNSLTPADRTVLVNLILRYINDAVLASHFPGITHTGGALFTGHRIFLEGMEAYLASHGGGRFVPLPKWNPATRIPDEFFPVVKPRDDGTPRPPLTNQTPNLPLPARFASPAVCSYANADQLGNDINGWHGSVHGAVGGTMTDISNSPAAPIFWPWHAFIDDVYYDWQQCHPVTNHLWSSVKAVPGWFGAEDQGADIATTELGTTGRPDLIVFHVDNPGGENHGYYRVGFRLDLNGNATGGWSPVKAVPGWFGAEDQGAGIALADISGNGRPDLVVFHVDNPGGENHGYYRIGWNLNASGDVTGGWSPIIPVPGWFGAEDQGAGIALADLNGNGRPDLVVFHLDNPGGENHGYYRVGRNLDTSGKVTGGWSPIRAVPGWFGSQDQGAGIAIGNIHGHGNIDLVVFHIDNPPGENHGYYRVGFHLDADGIVNHGWGPVRSVLGWFGSQDQGGGIAIVDVDSSGSPDLLVLHVDNPAGENHGYYRIGWNLNSGGDVT